MINTRKQLAWKLAAALVVVALQPAIASASGKWAGSSSAISSGTAMPLASMDATQDMLFGSVVTAAAVGGFACAWGIANRRNRRLQLISEAADRLVKGQFDTRLNVSGNDTVAGVAASFNRLADELRHRPPVTPNRAASQQTTSPTSNPGPTPSGLIRRTEFLDRLGAVCSGSTRNFAVLLVEIDRFAVIHDTYGKVASDEVLTAVSDRMSSLLGLSCATGTSLLTLCKISTIAQLKDGQFAVLVDCLPAEDAARRSSLAEVTSCIREFTTEPVELTETEVILAPSIGVAVARADHDSAATLMRDANDALSRARSSGRSRSVIFDPEIHAEAVERMRLESALRGAHAGGELSLSYQPISDLGDKTILGFEALLRWNHKGQSVSPAVFVPIAEEAGLMVAIGEWVIESALKQLRLWTEAAGRPLSVSVNVTRRQASDPHLIAHLREQLEAHRLNPGVLTLEIKESILMESMEARSMIEEVRRLGVRVHIDDFGGAYRSLSSLNLYPADGLKIDRSFILDQTGRKDPRSVLEAIVKLSHNLGMPVVAEGIETLEQAELLQSLDFDRGQGFLLARPMSGDQATALLESVAARQRKPVLKRIA